jgi:hypothetical protein
MIIGISGKIGSGKDTIGQIIQYLTTSEETLRINPVYNQGFEYTMNYSKQKEGFPFHNSDWEIKKFAGKLKEIASMLTGATLEQLEDQDFKKQLLGPEWQKVIRYKSYDELTPQQKERVSDNHGNKYLVAEEWTPDYRWLLQTLGTDALRNVVHENVWVNALMADYGKNVWDPTPNDFIEPNWIITDMRFPNEMDAVKAKGGITIRVNRKGFPITHSKTGETHLLSREAFTEHPSETALDNHNFDYVIDNNSSISDLIDKVREILTQNNII